MNNNIIPLTIKTLLSEGRYLIPIYQRNYDWGEKEALQLIEDIADYASFKAENNYYIGSLVVFIRNKDNVEYFETIDGQQRLTTLTILMNVLRSFDETKSHVSWFVKPNLSYAHRGESDQAIRLLSENKLYDSDGAGSIAEVYRIMQKNIKSILAEKKITMCNFADYLLTKVIIMRIPVPKDTELNHYFEIMNSRGEQLEKHEVLKASLMSHLSPKYHILFNELWEACADMDMYIQMKFKPHLRKLIFSENWSEVPNKTFEELSNEYANNKDWGDKLEESAESVSRSIADLLDDAKNNVEYKLPKSDDDSKNEGSERFGSIINFPNFLLHTLKIMYNHDDEYNDKIDEIIKLDDKRLIDIFTSAIAACNNKSAFIERFIMSLVKIRNLFDCYVIKRENYNSKEGWSLKSLKKYNNSKINYVGTFSQSDNEDDYSKDIRMLEAMFHVSAPTQIYKHWLNATLLFLYTKGRSQTELRDYLFELACTYMLDRYLCEDKGKVDFEDIIYNNHCEAKNSLINWKFIDRGCDVENFVFNFYDYLTWKSAPEKYPKFEFSYRTSVEHFYPQTPMPGCRMLDKSTGLHDFGNLCLISRGMNSKFSNNMPVAKYKNFGNEEVLNELSLKLKEMMEIVKAKRDWTSTEIKQFEENARQKLYDGIVKGCKHNISTMN